MLIDPLKDYVKRVHSEALEIKKKHGDEAFQDYMRGFYDMWGKINGFGTKKEREDEGLA